LEHAPEVAPGDGAAVVPEGADDPPPIVRLPSRRDPQAPPTYKCARYRGRLEAPLLLRIRALGVTQACTLYVTLLGAYHILLHRLTGQDDVAVGINALRGDGAAPGSIIGYRVNPWTTRTQLA